MGVFLPPPPPTHTHTPPPPYPIATIRCVLCVVPVAPSVCAFLLTPPRQEEFEAEQSYTAKMLHFIHHENPAEHFKVLAWGMRGVRVSGKGGGELLVPV